jgi:hypothetical protein
MLRTAANALSTHEMKVLSCGHVLCAAGRLTLDVARAQELESCIIAVRNTKLKEEKDAQTKAKKRAFPAPPRFRSAHASYGWGRI